jgi:hypothetical protein
VGKYAYSIHFRRAIKKIDHAKTVEYVNFMLHESIRTSKNEFNPFFKGKIGVLLSSENLSAVGQGPCSETLSLCKADKYTENKKTNFSFKGKN